MHLCLFEDESVRTLHPLTHFRPAYDLRCGMLTLRQRAVHLLAPRTLSLHARGYLSELLREENPGCEVNTVPSSPCLFVNGRLLLNTNIARILRKSSRDALFFVGTELAAARLSGERLESVRSSIADSFPDFNGVRDLPATEFRATVIRYPWDLVYHNEESLAEDYALLARRRRWPGGNVHKSAVLIGKKNIRLGRNSGVGAGVVLDASNGPIVVGANAVIDHQAVIAGPCFIGDGARIRVGAKIYGPTSIGPVSKVGGEVEHSILQSHANKQHDGYLGHSYLGMWVNLGAGTTTSNLKNTYGTIRVIIDGKQVDSGRMFLGLIAGDHVKIGINGTLDTGTVIGSSSNIYGSLLPPKFIPAFSWGDARKLDTYDVERAFAVAVKVMARRNVAVSPAYERVFRHVFSLTGHERSHG